MRVSATAVRLLASLVAPAAFVFAAPVPVSSGQPVQPVVDADQLTPEDELVLARKAVLSNRPYKIDYGLIEEVLLVKVLPSMATSARSPDWWSEKQGYDLARLYAMALGKYSVLKVLPPQTWDQKALADERQLSGSSFESRDPTGSVHKPPSRANATPLLGNKEFEVRLNVADYSFQHMPVRRRGIGIGFIALNSKECSTETYLRSDLVLSESVPGFTADHIGNRPSISRFGEGGDRGLVFDRLIVDKTGGASLNLNFLVGGAGGGNFTPPDKPLKKIIYQSVVDGAEAAFCLLTNQKDCLAYYKSRGLQSPTVLTAKQRRKVGGC